MDAGSLTEKINTLLRNHEYDRIKETLLEYKDITEHNNDLATVFYLIRIYEQEKAAGQKPLFEKTGTVSGLLERYTILKFYLRRMDFDVIGESMQDFYSYMTTNQVSAYELMTVMEYSVVHKDKVLKIIRGEEQKGTGLYE